MSPTLVKRVPVLGSAYSVLPRAQVREFLLAHALARKGSYVCVSNVHTTMMGFWDKTYRRITNESLLSVPDGVPLVWAMRLLGARKQDRVRGPTLMRDLCAAGVAVGAKHYLFGSTPETLQLLETQLRKDHPGILLVGSESPPFRPLSAQENAGVLARVEASGAHFLWVGLGAPKQEIWMGLNAKSEGALLMGIGAAFDLLAGRISEAPAWMQSAGLEWVYRFYKEPRRLWRRYLYNNPAFVFFFSLQMLKRTFLRKGCCD